MGLDLLLAFFFTSTAIVVAKIRKPRNRCVSSRKITFIYQFDTWQLATEYSNFMYWTLIIFSNSEFDNIFIYLSNAKEELYSKNREGNFPKHSVFLDAICRYTVLSRPRGRRFTVAIEREVDIFTSSSLAGDVEASEHLNIRVPRVEPSGRTFCYFSLWNFFPILFTSLHISGALLHGKPATIIFCQNAKGHQSRQLCQFFACQSTLYWAC